MPTDRRSTLTLATQLDPSATQAMEKMARATRAAADEEKKYQQQLRGRAGLEGGIGRSAGRYLGSHLGAGRVGGFLGGQLGSGLGGAGAVLGGVVAVYGSLATVAEKTAGALEVLNNGAMTAAQKQDALAKQFIPGAESFLKLRDAVNGVTESLRQLAVSQQARVLAQTYLHEKETADTAARAEMAHFGNRADAFRGVTVPDTLLKLAGGRGTYAGELAYQQAATRFPHEAALSRAEAEARAARADLNDSQTRLGRMEADRRRLTERMGRARQAERQSIADGNAFGADAGQNQVERTRAGIDALLAEQDVLKNEALIQQEINRQKELGVTLAQKESEVRKAQNNLLKADLQLLQQKEQRQATAAQSLGMMSPAQRAMAVQAVRMAQTVGDVGLLPPSLRALAQQVAPGLVGKIAERAGAGSREFRQLQDLGAVDRGGLDETRRELARVQTQVEVNVHLDEEALSRRIADHLGKALGKLIDSINAKFQAEAERLRTGQNLKNAAGG